jgi:putative two-component system response regulator
MQALVVDDDPAIGRLVARNLATHGFDVLTAASLAEARELARTSSFDVVVSDVGLPDGSGIDLVVDLHAADERMATVVMTGAANEATVSDALGRGVDEYLSKPFTAEQLNVAVAAAVRRRTERREAAQEIARLQEQPNLPDLTLNLLAKAGRFRDEETAEHVERMSRTCALIARELGWSDDECRRLRAAAALHDIGKIAVPDAVLRKPGRLTPEESAAMQRHPEVGHEILDGSSNPVLELAATVALSHHEQVDGTGYPRGLVGEEIPVAGRIAAVADVFDALTHHRVYRPAMEMEEALATLRGGRGTQFDSQILDAFESVLPAVIEMQRLYTDGAQAAIEEPGEDRPTRVLLVEDHDAVARGLELLLRRDGFEVTGTAPTLERAHALLERRGAEVAVVDIDLGGESGLDFVETAIAAGTAVLLYTGRADPETVAAAMRSGASGLASKAGSPAEFLATVREVAAGHSVVDSRLRVAPVAEPVRRKLTPREREVVSLLAEGLNGEEIAERLFLSNTTVRTHVRNAMERLGARTRAHLIALAAVAGDIVIGGPAD